MIYRKFGNTGEMISSLGFGCMRLPEVEKDGVGSRSGKGDCNVASRL